MADKKLDIPGLALMAIHGGPKAAADDENPDLRSAMMDLAHALSKMEGDGRKLEDAACAAACDAFRRAVLACEAEPHAEDEEGEPAPG